MKHSFLYLLILLMLTSCERDADVNLDLPQKSKLVCITFLGAGDQSVVGNLTRSTPVIGTPTTQDPTYVTDGTGTLSHNNNSYMFEYDGVSGYSASMGMTEVTPGETYHVEFSDDKETVRGSTVVPYPAQVDMALIGWDSVSESGVPTLKIHLSCTSRSAGTSYIQLIPVIVYSDSNRLGMTDYFAMHTIPTLQNGQSFTDTYSTTLNAGEVYPVRVEVTILSCNEPYAKFYNTTSGFDYSTLTGIFGEPRLAYSNMSNGIGVVAAYTHSGSRSFPLHQ